MKMNLGGPVWHASIATRRLPVAAAMEAEALRQLRGVGDAGAGEWREWSGRAFHLRRRLTVAEAAAVGPVVDIRGTAEAVHRAGAHGVRLRHAPRQGLVAELGPIAAAELLARSGL